MMKKLILAIFCLSIISGVLAQYETNDAEFLKITKEFKLNNDGSIDYHYTKQLKLNTYFAINRLYGETFIIYNTDFQSLKINSSYTIMADGKKVPTPENAFNEVLPSFSNNSPAYNNIREMVVTHTGLERNSVINLDYTINSKQGFYDALMGNEILNESSPVNELIIKIIVPDQQKLNYKLINIDAKVDINKVKGNIEYTWKLISIPAQSKEYYQSNKQFDAPRLIFSTAKDLKFVYDKFISQDAFKFNLNENMNNKVEEIIAAETDELKIALILQEFVCNDISNLNVPLYTTGFKCRNAIDTWNSNQGTQLEKAILLYALMQKANLKSEIYTIIPSVFYNKDLGDLNGFSEFVVKIISKKYGEVFISPNYISGQNLKYSTDGYTALLLDKNVESLKTNTLKTFTKEISVKGNFNIKSEENIDGKIDIELKANANPYLKFLSDSSYVKSLISNISSTNITNSNIVKLSEEYSKSEIEFSGNFELNNQNNYFTFNMPYSNTGVQNWHYNLLTSERNSVMELPDLINEEYEYSITLPDNYQMVSNLVNIELKNTVGHLLIKFEKKSNKILITKQISFNQKIIDPIDYGYLKIIMDSWNNTNYQKLIFKKIK